VNVDPINRAELSKVRRYAFEFDICPSHVPTLYFFAILFSYIVFAALKSGKPPDPRDPAVGVDNKAIRLP
jgi:hypothetical protein